MSRKWNNWNSPRWLPSKPENHIFTHSRNVLFSAQGQRCFYCEQVVETIDDSRKRLLLSKNNGGIKDGANVVMVCAKCVLNEDRLPTAEEIAKANEIYQICLRLIEKMRAKAADAHNIKHPSLLAQTKKLLAGYEKIKNESREDRKKYREQKKRRKSFGSCLRKLKHTTYSEAIAYLIKYHKAGSVVYKCLVCTGYHIGRSKEFLRSKRDENNRMPVQCSPQQGASREDQEGRPQQEELCANRTRDNGVESTGQTA